MLRHDYSLSERAVGLWSSLMLGILAMTSLGLHYVIHPISCWTPPQFTHTTVQYAREYCFHKTDRTFDLLSLQNSPHSGEAALHHTFHQWTPFALGIGAILCLLPHFLWCMLSTILWLDPHTLALKLADNQRYNAAGRHVMLKDSALFVYAGLRGGHCKLTAAAVGRKVLALVVCVLQLILIVLLFQPQLSGKDNDRDDEKDTEDSGFIPLQQPFYCYLELAFMKHTSRYTVQCTMPLAQVYSKGFTFLFYFFMLLKFCCVVDLLTVVCRVAIPGLRDSSLWRYLAVSEADTDPQRSAVLRRFLDSLGMDGRLVVAVTADVCGPLAAADLTNHLWTSFRSSLAMADSSRDPDASPLVPKTGDGQETEGAQSEHELNAAQ